MSDNEIKYCLNCGTELIGGLLVVTLALLGGAATGVSTHGWSGGASYAVFFLGIGVALTCGLHAIDAFVLEMYEQELTSDFGGLVGEIEEQILRDGIAIQSGVYVSLLGGVLMTIGTLVPENS